MPTMRRQPHDFAPPLGDRHRRSLRDFHNVGRSLSFRRAPFGILAFQFLGEAEAFHDAPDDQIQMPLTEPPENTRQLRPFGRMPERDEQNPEYKQQDRLGPKPRIPARRPILGTGSG